MASFVSRQAQRRKLIDLFVASYRGLDYSLVDKIITYADSLIFPGKQEISFTTFLYEMTFRFNLTNAFLISAIFSKTNNTRGGARNSLTVEQYSRLICTFLTSDTDVRVNYVFNVYDIDGDGLLSKYEVHTMLMTTLPQNSEEQDEMLKDLIDIVLKLVDRDFSGTIDINEFGDLVKKDVLYIELLGQVLPDSSLTQVFKDALLTKTHKEIREFIVSERNSNIITPPDSRKEATYFPLRLDCE